MSNLPNSLMNDPFGAVGVTFSHKALFDEADWLFITGLEITQTPQYVYGS